MAQNASEESAQRRDKHLNKHRIFSTLVVTYWHSDQAESQKRCARQHHWEQLRVVLPNEARGISSNGKFNFHLFPFFSQNMSRSNGWLGCFFLQCQNCPCVPSLVWSSSSRYLIHQCCCFLWVFEHQNLCQKSWRIQWPKLATRPKKHSTLLERQNSPPQRQYALTRTTWPWERTF